MFFKQVDDLPTGVDWRCEMITVHGNELDETGKPIVEKLELWMCDPVECVRELIGNPVFDGDIAYAPERVYADAEGKIRVIDEMWTADWWYDTQVHRLRLVRISKPHVCTPYRESFLKAW